MYWCASNDDLIFSDFIPGLVLIFLLLVISTQILDALCGLYSLLREEDMWSGLWRERCIYPDTAKAISYEQQGFFEQAQVSYIIA